VHAVHERSEVRRRREVVEVARRADRAGAHVVVEVPDQRADDEPHRADRTLQLERLFRLARAEREEDVGACAPGRGLGSPREEERGAGVRVRRVGEDGVGPAGVCVRERLAQVVADKLDGKRRIDERPTQEVEQRGIDVHDRDPAHGRARAQLLHDERDRKRGQVVVAEQENASVLERTRLVEGEDAADLRLDGAMGLVDVEPRRRGGVRVCRELVRERLERRRDDDLAP
jgi:hypothetical protein